MEQITIFKSLYKSNGVPFHRPLSFVLERIKKGYSKDIINRVRGVEDKEERNQIKSSLPCILFSGTFTKRNANSQKEHSNLIILDYDDFKDQKDLINQRKELENNKHIVSVFISPSGNGLKAVLRVCNKINKDNHAKYYKSFNNDFPSVFWDNSGSDVCRVCYESYDPNIYINYEAEPYSPVIVDDGYKIQDRAPLIPITNEDVIINKIMKFNWSKDFREGERNAFIFDLAGAFCEYGITQSYATSYIINNVVIGDFTEREATTAINSAYKTRSFNVKYFENNNRINSIKRDVQKGREYVKETHKIDDETFDVISKEKENVVFWVEKKNKVIIDVYDFKTFLDGEGYKKYYPIGADKPTLVKVVSNIVEETSCERIKDFTLSFLLELEEYNAWKHCSSSNKLFSDNFLLMLDTIELSMLKDTKDKSYLAFRNGIIEVSKDNIKKIDYSEIDFFIWKHHIIDFDFKEEANNDNHYKQFIYNISSKKTKPFESVIGYLCSTYKNKSNNKAVICNDELISDNPEGGTGKGLFVQGIAKIRRSSILDGKAFDDKKSFPYQTVKQDCQILVFDDVKQKFSFLNKFSLITEGLTIERKNKDAIKLSVSDSPKLIITTNYPIEGSGNSHDRRRHEIEFAQHYGGDLTPEDEFGCQLFDEWSEEMFSRFYNYMISCIQVYLSNGLIPQKAKNVNLRKFQATTSKDFYDWISDNDNFQFNVRHNKDELFDKFVNDYTDFKKWLSKKRFNIWVLEYAKYLKLEAKQGKSNNNRWIIIESDKVKVEEIQEVPF